MTDRHGPQRTGRFQVEIDGFQWTGFREVNLPASSTEESEGTAPWGETTLQDLQMERSVQGNDTLMYDWREAVRDDDSSEGLHDVTVILQDEEGAEVTRWEFEDAWPKYYRPPQLDASEDDGVATERVTLAYSSVERIDD